MSRIVTDTRRGKLSNPPPDEAHWWRLVIPGSENFNGDPDVSDPDFATWMIPDGRDETFWTLRNGAHVHRIPDPALPPMMSRIDAPKCWHFDLLSVGPPTACDGWEKLTEPGHHVHPERTRPVTKEEQAADDERVLRLREERDEAVDE